ncbi:MAG: 4Fe-4S dicluster domain-containing protein [Chromatiales bacterium]|nr:4Fe-4S dicluster domain-containing protein [Chromatiales bacterium]
MTDVNETSVSRRRFVASAAAAAVGGVSGAMLVALPVQARRPGDPVTSKVRWGMLIDAAKCADGCDACVSACDRENGLTDQDNPDIDVRWIRKVRVRDRQTQRVTTLPMLCQHCETAPCVDVCPTGASMRRADGVVLVNMHTCIGCRYCMMACPFKARSFVHETVENQVTQAPRGKGCVTSCTLCVHKLDAGHATTACTQACKAEGHEAITFGDLNDPNSEVSRRMRENPSRQLRADLGLNQGVRYSGV